MLKKLIGSRWRRRFLRAKLCLAPTSLCHTDISSNCNSSNKLNDWGFTRHARRSVRGWCHSLGCSCRKHVVCGRTSSGSRCTPCGKPKLVSDIINWRHFSNFCNSWNSNVDNSRRLSQLTGRQIHRGPYCSNSETSNSVDKQCSLVIKGNYNHTNILISQKFRKSLDTVDEFNSRFLSYPRSRPNNSRAES